MSDTDWPEACDLATCSALFREAGFEIDPSNLSRYIAKNNFPSTKQGRSRFVDPKALFTACGHDYTRRKMAGQSAQPVPQLPRGPAFAPSHAPAPPRDDPRLERDRISLQQKRIELAREEKQLTPTVEVAAAAAESMAEFRAAIGELARDHADALVVALHLPAAVAAQVTAAFKKFGRACQIRFGEPQQRLAAAMATPGTVERERFEALVRMAIELRGETDPDDDAPAPESDPDPS